MLKGIAILVVGSLIVWGIQEHLKDAPNVTYTISDAIEIVGTQGTEYAQEITVSNSGNKPAKDISVKVPQHITSYKLTKHSEVIKEQVVSEEKRFELVYPELPNDQKFKILIRYEGAPIAKGWVSISSADGNAQALEKQTPRINFFHIWLAFTLGNIFYFIFDHKKYKRDSYLKWGAEGKEFSDKKPWFATSGEWPEMQYEAIKIWLNKYNYTPSIEHNRSYQLLNKSKPALLSQEYWISLQKEASSILENEIHKRINHAKTSELSDMIKLKKPEALPLKDWSEIQSAIKERIVANVLPRSIYSNSDELTALLKDDSLVLKNLPPALAEEIRTDAQENYIDYLTERVTRNIEEPQLTLRTANLDLLKKSQAEKIRNYLFKAARINGMPSFWTLSNLQKFISNGKPEWMEEDEFEDLSKFVSQWASLSDDRSALRQREIEIGSALSNAESLKIKALSQLDLIDKILSNPNSIDRIESYDDTFAPGNLENLKLVARTLKSAQ